MCGEHRQRAHAVVDILMACMRRTSSLTTSRLAVQGNETATCGWNNVSWLRTFGSTTCHITRENSDPSACQIGRERLNERKIQRNQNIEPLRLRRSGELAAVRLALLRQRMQLVHDGVHMLLNFLDVIQLPLAPKDVDSKHTQTAARFLALLVVCVFKNALAHGFQSRCRLCTHPRSHLTTGSTEPNELVTCAKSARRTEEHPECSGDPEACTTGQFKTNCC